MSLKSVGKTKDTAVVELLHPVTGEPLLDADKKPLTVTVYGPYSDHYRAINNAQQNARLQKAQRTGKSAVTVEQIQAGSLSVLVKCVKDWHVVVDKEPEPCTEENIRAVFKDYPWVREQVEAVFEDTKAFLG